MSDGTSSYQTFTGLSPPSETSSPSSPPSPPARPSPGRDILSLSTESLVSTRPGATATTARTGRSSGTTSPLPRPLLRPERRGSGAAMSTRHAMGFCQSPTLYATPSSPLTHPDDEEGSTTVGDFCLARLAEQYLRDVADEHGLFRPKRTLSADDVDTCVSGTKAIAAEDIKTASEGTATSSIDDNSFKALAVEGGKSDRTASTSGTGVKIGLSRSDSALVSFPEPNISNV